MAIEDAKQTKETYDEIELKRRLIEQMGTISSDLAHDLRSPLQTIQNAVFLLERGPENPLFYGMIRDSLRQATDILDNFRDFYKGHILKLVESDISKVYELAVSEMPIPGNVTIKTALDNVGSITMDPGKLSLVFQKLINNSIEIMEEGGEITIEAYEDEDNIVVSVSDNGPGIDKEVQEVIYKPFETKLKRGNGLGIPACKRIIESHGGTLSFETAEGEGTTFTFTLPKS
ncbi:MAG: HAMP domain-containing histidine kinase [Candidatus Bathyarchaeota archaeon]|nr:HAMP domain-containing histidine kinase [Candidatus Bathyarchaeota archaeon]